MDFDGKYRGKKESVAVNIYTMYYFRINGLHLWLPFVASLSFWASLLPPWANMEMISIDSQQSVKNVNHTLRLCQLYFQKHSN